MFVSSEVICASFLLPSYSTSDPSTCWEDSSYYRQIMSPWHGCGVLRSQGVNLPGGWSGYRSMILPFPTVWDWSIRLLIPITSPLHAMWKREPCWRPLFS